MKKVLSVLALASVLAMCAGCAQKVHKDWLPMGGSKSDATVKLGYSYDQLEIPIVNDYQAQNLAAEKCKAWGYDGAEPFGGKMTQMSGFSTRGQYNYNVIYEFQCTGGTTTKSIK